MSVLVTGAGGFVGRAAVVALAGAGHDVVALVRPAGAEPDFGPVGRGRVLVVRGDVRQPDRWRDGLPRITGVVHAAAQMGGGFVQQFQGTVVGTENVLRVLGDHPVERFVLVSSMSVYDFQAALRRGVLDEQTPLESDVGRRDAYTRAKLLQEGLVKASGLPFAMVRPGAVYGPGRTWDRGAAMTVAGVDLVLAPRSGMRLVHLDSAADALARALTSTSVVGRAVNVVDDDPLTYGAFHRILTAGTGARRIPVPWAMVRLAGWSAARANDVLFGGRGRLPEILSSARQVARWAPLRYPNDLARDLLGWTPRSDTTARVAALAAAPPSGPPAGSGSAAAPRGARP